MKSLSFLLCESFRGKALFFSLEVVRLIWKFVLQLLKRLPLYV
jgi:hypothetical protein